MTNEGMNQAESGRDINRSEGYMIVVVRLHDNETVVYTLRITERSGDVASGVDSPCARGCSSGEIEDLVALFPELESVVVSLGKRTGVSITPTPDDIAGTVNPQGPSAHSSWNVDEAERAIFQHEAMRNIFGVFVEADKTTATTGMNQCRRGAPWNLMDPLILRAGSEGHS